MAGHVREINSAYRRAFGDRLREVREEHGISQETLALRAGIARSYISGIERGVKNPALDHIVRLAGTLSVQPAELMPNI